ncbi:MAG TPA: hypothetical protein VD738_04245 [Nitrospira sp.]|nr:hypothetical protein [Nitrospira sp.]
MKHLFVPSILAFGLGVCLVSGCAGKGELRYLDLHAKQPPAQTSEMEPVKLAIESFEDRRAEKGRIGTRSHLWGGVTYFDVAGERPADVLAQTLADRLKVRGWRDRPWNVRVVPAGSATDADIVLSGQVQEFSANAKSRMFSTVIDTSTRFTVRARNLSDKSTTTRSIEGAQSRTVFWFEDEDMQELLSATLKDGIDRLIADTVIEQKNLRPARQ